MEKRTLLFLAISILVLVFWQYYFGLFQVPEQQPAQVTSVSPSSVAPQSTPGTGAAPVTPQSLPQDRLLQAERAMETWDVDSSLYEARMGSLGARLSSFQLKKFRQAVEETSAPMEMIPTRQSGYLPLAVDLLQHQNWQLSTLPYAGPEVKKTKLSGEGDTLSFVAEMPSQVRVTKTMTFVPDTYAIDMSVRLENLSQQPLNDQLGLSLYFQPYQSGEESSYNPSQLSYYRKGELTNIDVKDLQKKDMTAKPPVDWIGYENNYFLQAFMPMEDSSYQIVPKVLDENVRLLQVVYLTDPFVIPPGQDKVIKARLYIGPKQLDQLEKAGHHLVQAVDYGWFTFVAKPLLLVLKWFYTFTRNYGVAIILLTVIIKIVFWPLTQKSYESMQKMKKIQPRIAEVREKYKDDREKLNQELMQLYRTYKVNPMGGCLPMVLQIPVFFALYRMLNGAVELRHEPFMLWINDLTAPDRLSIGFSIPYLGGLPVLTILMGISMFVQQKMTPTGGDPRQEQMMLLMPVIFTVFFINFPSGLVLYWLVNNVLSIMQQYMVNRKAQA